MNQKSTRLWPDFIRYARPHVDWQAAPALLVLDPGETTGWAVFEQGLLFECGQWSTGRNPALMADYVRNAIQTGISILLYEEYRVRGNKFKTHVGSEVVTIQHIGAIQVVAAEYGIPTEKQGAGLAKGFATDTKLRRWGLYQTNQRHANDALRHGCYYLLFKYAPEHREHDNPQGTRDT